MEAQGAAAEVLEEAEDGAAAAPEPSEAQRLQQVLGSSGRPLQALPARGVAWLSARADTASGTHEARVCNARRSCAAAHSRTQVDLCQILQSVARHVESPAFLARLTAAVEADNACGSADGDARAGARAGGRPFLSVVPY